jgi:hypothetical protein
MASGWTAKGFASRDDGIPWHCQLEIDQSNLITSQDTFNKKPTPFVITTRQRSVLNAHREMMAQRAINNIS